MGNAADLLLEDDVLVKYSGADTVVENRKSVEGFFVEAPSPLCVI